MYFIFVYFLNDLLSDLLLQVLLITCNTLSSLHLRAHKVSRATQERLESLDKL